MKRMSQKVLNEKEIKYLKKTLMLKKVSEKSITYHDEFKQLFISQLDERKKTRLIFE